MERSRSFHLSQKLSQFGLLVLTPPPIARSCSQNLRSAPETQMIVYSLVGAHAATHLALMFTASTQRAWPFSLRNLR